MTSEEYIWDSFPTESFYINLYKSECTESDSENRGINNRLVYLHNPPGFIDRASVFKARR